MWSTCSESLAASAPLCKQGTVIGLPGSVRPYVIRVGERLHLYYEQYHLPLYRTSSIMLRTANIIIKETGSKENYISFLIKELIICRTWVWVGKPILWTAESWAGLGEGWDRESWQSFRPVLSCLTGLQALLLGLLHPPQRLQDRWAPISRTG